MDFQRSGGHPPPASFGVDFRRIEERLEALERKLDAIKVGQLDKDWYSTEEVAVMMGRAPWTVREWCRHGRIRARKRSGTDRWVVSRQELDRLMNEGLLPARR